MTREYEQASHDLRTRASPRRCLGVGLPLAAALAVGIVAPASAAPQAAACNNQTRHLTTSGGNYSTGTQNCPTWSFTVSIAGQQISFGAPASCDIGRREQSSDCFDCGPASDGNHCTARGFQVTVKISSIGGGNPCPQFPSSLPSTVEQANAAVQCKPLREQDPTVVWCASVTTCVDGKSESPYPDGATLNGPDGAYVVRLGDPDSLLVASPPESVASQLRALQTLPASELTDVLREVVLTHAPVSAVGNLWARVVTEYPAAPGGSAVSIERNYRGALGVDGAFNLDVPYRVLDENGKADNVTERVWFDGASLVTGIVGAPFYNVWVADSANLRPVLHTKTAHLAVLRAWVDNPFRILRFPGTSYATEVDTVSGRVTVVESYPQVESPGGAGRTIYTIDTSTGSAHPLRIEVVDDLGRTLRRTNYEDYRALATGVWRPHRIVEEHFEPGVATPSFVTTTSIRSAQVLGDAQIESSLARPRSADNWWFVRL